MASATETTGNTQHGDEEEPLLGERGDIVQKPEQGFQWNLVTGMRGPFAR